MMSKYRIKEYRSGFRVLELRDVGGWAWIDSGFVFKTREDAEKYVSKKKGEKNERIS